MFLLDTDHISLLDRGGREATRIRERIIGHQSDKLGVTIVSYEEQFRGWMALMARIGDVRRQADVYERLEPMRSYYCRTEVIPFDQRAIDEFQKPWLGRIRLGTRVEDWTE